MDLIWGYGVVGQATGYALDIHYHYDENSKRSNFNFNSDNPMPIGEHLKVFVCVPTPTNKGIQDLTFIKDSLDKIFLLDKQAEVIIRSTVLPGTTRYLQNEYKKELMFLPEFLTEATALDDSIDPEFIFIGGDNNIKKLKILEKFDVDDYKKNSVSLETAELIKYAMNTFFGTKVVLGNIFRDIAEKTNADYWMVKEALEEHKWGSINGWNPFHGNKRGFGGKCLPKDIEAISRLDDTNFLSSLLEANEKFNKI